MADKCSVNGSGSISSTSNTKYTLKCTGSVTFGNWYWYGVRTRCYISGTQVATATGYTTGPNQTTASCSGTKTITRTHSSQTITWKVVSSSETVSGYGGVGESHTTSGTLTVPALPHQSVIYYANKGTGAPSTQTKWYGETLYLSKTKPTRTGYSFVCWNTNSSGTGDNYYPGDAYTSNASSDLKLYAKWQELTGTIEYNLNGGSGTVSSTTMYYTTEAFITSSVPTLTNYVFVGWSTTRYELNEGTADFSSGESFKDPNVIPQNTVLYAVWALAYIPPTISNFKVIRVANSSSTTLDENGEYAYISFDYSKPGYPVNGEMQRYDIGSASCTFKEIDAISPVNVSLTKVPNDPSDPDNGSYYGHTTSQNLVEIFKSYNFTITIYDTTHSELPGSTVIQSVVVPTSFVTIDCGAGGRSIGLGRQAVSTTNANGLLTVGMDVNFENITTAPTVTDPNDNTTKVATTEFVQMVAAGGSSAIPNPYDTNPEMNGTASYGSSTEYSRGDHVHPSDTNKANAVHTHSASDITTGLATVATSGSYSDLSNKPTIPSAPVQSDWTETDTSDLSYILNKPTLATVATSGSYSDLSGTPTLATVATSGLYSDLSATPTLASVATSGSYNDLTDKPTIPSASAFGASIDVANRAQAPYDVRVRLLNGDGTELSSDSIPAASSSVMGVMTPTQYSKLDGIESGAEVNVQSDWSESDSSSDAYIQNKPALATVATTGDYDDLIDKPTIPPVKTWYGTSNTDAATAAKTVTCSGFSLSDGAIIGILFSTANTAATPTLNVNSTGDTTVYVGDATVNSTTNTLKWSANTMLYFMYDGTYWRYIGAMAAASVVTPDGGGAWWGTSSTAATTRAKASTIANYRLTKGAIVAIRFSNTNTYTSNSVQLNINSTGAKSIYNKAGATSSTNTFTWAANDTLLFMFDGSYYRYIGGSSYDVPSPSSAMPEMNGTGAAGSSADYARADHVHPSDTSKVDVSSLASVATSGSYSDLSGTPTLATVATSGSYSDLSNKPTIPSAPVQSDWTETDTSDLSYILNKPTLATVATSGLYSDLSGTPTLATVATSGDYDDLTDKPTIPDTSGLAAEISVTPMFSGTVKLTLSNEAGTQIDTAEIGAASSSASGVMTQQQVSKLNGIASGAEVNVQSDWDETDSTSDAYIQNKPALATVATTGSYNDLADKPSIPAAPVQSDWTEADTSSLAYIDNKPTLATVATSGSYNDLNNKPSIPKAGLPLGGASGQVLTKMSQANYAATWSSPHYVPSGGSAGQVLAKASGTDYDVGWVNQSGGGGGVSLQVVSGTADNQSVSASSYVGVNIAISVPSGYTPIGVVGIHLANASSSGTGVTLASIAQFFIQDSTHAYVRIKNPSSTALKLAVTADVLCVSN